MKRVVITGMGIYSCIGKNVQEVRDSLYYGKSGIIYDEARKKFGYRSALTGFVERPNLKDQLDRRSRNMMPEQAEYAYVATKEAMKMALIDEDYFQQHEVGLIYGNDSTAKATIESMDVIREKKDTVLVGSNAVFQVLNSTINMNLSTIFKLRGINLTLSAACASGSHAIGMAMLLIQQGLQDMVVCGGGQEVGIYSMPTFDAIGAFSTRENEPQKASRPFDRDRDGLVPSGGAATVIVESLESALKRNVPIIGEIVGYGFSSNGEHIANPSVDGPARSLKKALTMAGMKPSDIDYLNAHATSTPGGDASEAKAIYEVFKDGMPHISSTKGMTGHECWMAGASEVVYSSLMMQHDFMAPNLNFENPDEDSKKLNIIRTTIQKKFNVFLSNSFGFGGTNSSIIIKKYST